jgi:hypothetical protein
MDEKKQSIRGIPQYRCQRCMETTMDVDATPAPFAALDEMMSDPLATAAHGVTRLMRHPCDDGGAGVAVIVGMFPEHHVQSLRDQMQKHREAAAAHAAQEEKRSKSVN